MRHSEQYPELRIEWNWLSLAFCAIIIGSDSHPLVQFYSTLYDEPDSPKYPVALKDYSVLSQEESSFDLGNRQMLVVEFRGCLLTNNIWLLMEYRAEAESVI